MPDRPSRSIIVLIGGLLCLWVACAGIGPFGERVPEEQRRAYEAALEPLPDDPATAQSRLEAFLKTFPKSLLADDATEELARLALLQGRPQEAFARLREVIRSYPKGNRVDSVRVRLARWEWDQGRSVEAVDLVESVRLRKLDPSDRRAFYRLLARMSDEPVDELLNLASLRKEWADEVSRLDDEPSSASEREKTESRLRLVDTEIDDLFLSMSWEQLTQVSAALGREIPAGRVELTLVWREMVGGQLEEARARLLEVEKYPLTSEGQERLANLKLRLQDDSHAVEDFVPDFDEALAGQWPDLVDAQGTLGVVLPLSGRYAPFGQAVLQGILLAAEVFKHADEAQEAESGAAPVGLGDTANGGRAAEGDGAVLAEIESSMAEAEPGKGVRLLVRDSAGDPDQAAAAVRELAADERVVAVIGPMFSAESEAAADQAELLGIPLLALSNRMSIPNEKKWVFRLRLTPEDEVGALVEYAVDEMELSRFAILYPTNRYGRGMRARYWDTVRERGGQVVAVAGYDPAATDFNDSIRKLVGYDLLTPNEQVALEERAKAMRRGRRLEPEEAGLLREILYSQLGPEMRPLPPLVDFDALFIPDSHDKIQLIAPQLAFHEVDGVQLLGSSQWNDPELVKIGRSHVRGAVISTGFDVNSAAVPVNRFVSDFRAEFSLEPDEFSAGGYDATRLVLTQWVSGRTSRAEVRDGLLLVYGYPGASGVTTIGPDGNARKRPFLLQVKRGRFRAVD
ncbi:MAG: penicillin-binding protein activator [Myxococcota bacterium]|nr:penicillin-binding protein activator [Myxococcota bacterium]